jgi:hypothetical protein
MKMTHSLTVAVFCALACSLLSDITMAESPTPNLAVEEPFSGKTNELKDTLIALEKQSWEAWKNRDSKFFTTFLSDDHVDLWPTGPINKAATVSTVGSPACVVKSYAVDKFQLVSIDANTALLTYFAQQDTACGGNAVPSPAWVSSLYVRRAGRWVNVFYQQTPTK